ncbi:aldo/keto reductase [Paenibacillus roseipurpureus]|uniref:Aldo/keto reductase n=1 Tax=Paenibacillus roseopurpureus TaxID=2918901 RepID=A0AA96LJF4_9BACL|nr:aldo/keto reductase [Paenibacillus sp. MBLB1832]WNR42840.1 aldo/keto reductase [Paenibacillus sp. MBLB1832]
MKYTIFPRSGQSLSKLGYGAMGLGGHFGNYDDAYMIQSVLTALENGVNVIDTARAYGRSEELVGKALKEWKGERPFVASKVLPTWISDPSYPVMSGWHHPAPVELVYPPGSIRASTEESLRQMNLDTIDLIQMHNYWPMWDTIDYWMEELLQLKEEGKVRFIGISVPDHRPEVVISLVRSGVIDSVQVLLNIFDPLALDCLVPICQHHDVAVMARIILDEGGLTGFLQEDTQFPTNDFRNKYFDVLPRPIYIEKVDRLREFIPANADNLAELAIKFAIHHPGVTTALTSMQVHEYAQANIASIDKPDLSHEVFKELQVKHRWIRNFYQARRHV